MIMIGMMKKWFYIKIKNIRKCIKKIDSMWMITIINNNYNNNK